MEKNNNGGLIAIIIILLVVLLGVCGYVAYDKGLIFNNEKSNEEVENDADNVQDKVEEIALDDAGFIDIYNKLKDYTYTSNRENGYSDFLDSEKTIIGFYNSDIKASDVTRVDNGATDVVTYKMNADVLSTTLKKIFGNNINFNRDLAINNYFEVDSTAMYQKIGINFGCGGRVASYDSTTNVYYINLFGGCGGVTGPSAKLNLRKIVSAKKINDTIVVEEKAIYINESDVDGNYTYEVYADSNKTKLIDTLMYHIDTLNNQSINVDSYIEQASTITHTYKLDESTGNYYFVSSIIK